MIILTLVVLAAGLGSRFGGVKQITPLTDNGEFVIDFTVYDAVRAGFDRVIFIIREEHRDAFDKTIGARIRACGIKVEYAYQRPELPDGYTAPAGRTKPWGTAHAMMSIGTLPDNFGVVNADDFYGLDTFNKLHDFLKTAKGDHYCSIGYKLENTLSENGFVSRGICMVENGYLTALDEKTKIRRSGDIAINSEPDGTETKIPLNSVVSMNCFGFTPGFTGKLYKLFIEFLEENRADLSKCEFYLPVSVEKLMIRKECDVRSIPTKSKWMGVTYREDSQAFSDFIKEQRACGYYPSKLW